MKNLVASSARGRLLNCVMPRQSRMSSTFSVCSTHAPVTQPPASHHFLLLLSPHTHGLRQILSCVCCENISRTKGLAAAAQRCKRWIVRQRQRARRALRRFEGHAADGLSRPSLHFHHGPAIRLMAPASGQRNGKGETGFQKSRYCECGKNKSRWKRRKNCGSARGRREPAARSQRHQSGSRWKSDVPWRRTPLGNAPAMPAKPATNTCPQAALSSGLAAFNELATFGMNKSSHRHRRIVEQIENKQGAGRKPEKVLARRSEELVHLVEIATLQADATTVQVAHNLLMILEAQTAFTANPTASLTAQPLFYAAKPSHPKLLSCWHRSPRMRGRIC